MDSIVEYLDAAKSRLGIKADWKLAVELGLSPAWASRVRSGKDLPSDDVMLRLCEIAGANIERGLLQLNLWRAPSVSVSERYSRLLQRLAPVLAIFALVIGGSSSVHAATNTVQTASGAPEVYILSKIKRYLLLARAYIRRMHPIYLVTS